MLLAALSMIFPAPAAVAWDSGAHTGFIQVTPEIWNIPGMSDSYRPWVFHQQAWYWRQRRPTIQAQKLAFLNLVCGTDEPDRNRQVYHALSHQSDAEERSVNAFNAAANAYRQAGAVKAASHLGHSIHYLQDRLDVSKEMAERDAKVIRAVGLNLGQKYLNHLSQTRQVHPDLLQGLRQWTPQFANSPTDPAEFLQRKLTRRSNLASFFKRRLAETADPSLRHHVTNELVSSLVHYTVAVQGVWIGMYLNYIGVGTPRAGWR